MTSLPFSSILRHLFGTLLAPSVDGFRYFCSGNIPKAKSRVTANASSLFSLVLRTVYFCLSTIYIDLVWRGQLDQLRVNVCAYFGMQFYNLDEICIPLTSFCNIKLHFTLLL